MELPVAWFKNVSCLDQGLLAFESIFCCMQKSSQSLSEIHSVQIFMAK